MIEKGQCIIDIKGFVERMDFTIKPKTVEHAKKLMVYSAVYGIKMYVPIRHLHAQEEIENFMDDTCYKETYRLFSTYLKEKDV